MKHVSIVDKNGFCISRTELQDENGILITYELREGEQTVEKITNVDLIKPKWNFDSKKWIEGATEEEIKEHEEESKPKPKELTVGETLSKEVANIKIENMKKDAIITNALQTIASLKVEIMELKGGNK
ncbi:hypothetical protein DVV81_04855 [Clostridium botulinum]|uniref:hypothetical protein n=1 Tax=Clostridium botulinum TaxID=1491 RepID=UPI001401628C|nr:hypothetical protein [Clostridium botulinum]MBN1070502.1 hypothetical protein [Clostridium botulinum]MBY6915496.1 hypothetical protein [Clostridium botulinum]NFQ38287.1 hypothetical protein [Clostridium botulinum]